MKKALLSIGGIALFYGICYLIFGCFLLRIYDRNGIVLDAENHRRVTHYQRDWLGGKETRVFELRYFESQKAFRWTTQGENGKWGPIIFRDTSDGPDE